MRVGNAQFDGLQALASNVGVQRGEYTLELFQQDFPQFFTPSGMENPAASLVPPAMLREFIRQANAVIQPDTWLDGWRYAAGLYVAHQATLYLRTYSNGSATTAQAAATGALVVGVVKSAALGDVSVTYDTDSLTRATESWGDLNATQYGQRLATRARLVGMAGTYVI